MFLVFAPGHAIRTCYSPQLAQVGEDFSHNLLAPSSSLPPSHMGVIMCQPGGSHSGIQQKETWLQVKMKNDEDSAKLTVTVAVSLLTESQI